MYNPSYFCAKKREVLSSHRLPRKALCCIAALFYATMCVAVATSLQSFFSFFVCRILFFVFVREDCHEGVAVVIYHDNAPFRAAGCAAALFLSSSITEQFKVLLRTRKRSEFKPVNLFINDDLAAFIVNIADFDILDRMIYSIVIRH